MNTCFPLLKVRGISFTNYPLRQVSLEAVSMFSMEAGHALLSQYLSVIFFLVELFFCLTAFVIKPVRITQHEHRNCLTSANWNEFKPGLKKHLRF